MMYFVSVLVSFCAVAIKGFQHKNVAGMHYRLTFFTSYIMAVFDVAVVGIIVKGGWSIALTAGLGASCGMVFAMWFHDRVIK
jgi:hypothetical protein